MRTLIGLIFLLILNQAMAQSDVGESAYLGVRIQPDALAQRLKGALVEEVYDNGPAKAAGIARGDLIIRFDGKEVRQLSDLPKIVARTPAGKDVVVIVIRGGREESVTVKLGKRLMLSGAELNAYRQMLNGMLQELLSLGVSKGRWDDPELQKFSELLQKFEELKKTALPDDREIQVLWRQLEHEFVIHKKFVDNILQSREAGRNQPSKSEEIAMGQLGPLYMYYMMLEVCIEKYPQFENARSGLRDFLRSKELEFPREQTDKIWNAMAVGFQKVESALRMASEIQLYTECDRASRKVAALMVFSPGAPAQGTSPRKKDF